MTFRDRLLAPLLTALSDADLDEVETTFRVLPVELRQQIRANLGVLLLLPARVGMPDPQPHRARLAALAARLEAA